MEMLCTAGAGRRPEQLGSSAHCRGAGTAAAGRPGDERIQLNALLLFCGSWGPPPYIPGAAAPTDPGSEKVSALRGGGLWPPAADADGELRHCQQLWGSVMRAAIEHVLRLPHREKRLTDRTGARFPLMPHGLRATNWRTAHLLSREAGRRRLGSPCSLGSPRDRPGVRGGAEAVSGTGGLYPGRSDTWPVLPGGRVNTFRYF